MKYPKYLLILLLFCTTLSHVRCDLPVVNTTTALIRGSEMQLGNVTVKQFLGIPFAVPPVGDLRFRKTEPLEGWSGEVNATNLPPACNQDYPIDYDVIDTEPGNKSEDCLYLNIWAPGDASPENPKAVMFWLYAGSFTTGSNRLPVYDGKGLAARGNMIVVTSNYRLGIFGFLSTDSEKAPGNMGVYDALEALKWVNSNIKFFGGDVSRITLSGNTAGSFISVFFMVSPLSRGMFQRVILESGSNLTYTGKEVNMELGQRVASAANCTPESQTLQNNTDEVIDCLKSKPAKDLAAAVRATIGTSVVSFFPVYGDDILPENLSKAFEDGDVQNVSVLIGNAADEEAFKLITENVELFGPYGEKDPDINKTYGTQLFDEIITPTIMDPNDRKEIASYYFSNVTGTDYKYQVARAISDLNLLCNDYYFALQFYQSFDLFFYYFSHNDTYSKFASWVGAIKYSEIPYVFGVPINNFTDGEAQLSGKMMDLWSNFVKEGVPSPDWKTFDGSDPEPYVEILKVEGDAEDSPYQRFENCKFLRQFTTDNRAD